MPLVLLLGADYGLKLVLFVSLAAAWLGTFRLARELQLSPSAASLAAIIATWSGFSIGHLMSGHVTITIEYAAIPWLFLALVHLLRRPGPRSAAAFSALAATMVVSGHPQLPYYAALFLALWTAGSLALGGAAGHRKKALGWILLAACTALLLAMIQIAPTVELIVDGLPETRRTKLEHIAEFSLDALDLVRLVCPNVAGNPFAGPEPLDAADHYHERVAYLGLAAPLLALFGLTRAGVRRWQWAMGALVVLAFAIALGRSTLVFDVLAYILPGLKLFRCHGRIFGIASFFVALLAGRGLDALLNGDRRAPRHRAGLPRQRSPGVLPT